MVDSSSTPPDGVRIDPTAFQGVRVGYLTVVLRDDIDTDAAHHLINDIAGDAISYDAVVAVKCDVAAFDQGGIDAFYAEAAGE